MTRLQLDAVRVADNMGMSIQLPETLGAKEIDWRKNRQWCDMSTVKWTREIDNWIKERCPIREHGYTQIQHMVDELNKMFHTDFSITAFKANCYSKGFNLGVMKAQTIVEV